jgi:hypothetical protein
MAAQDESKTAPQGAEVPPPAHVDNVPADAVTKNTEKVDDMDPELLKTGEAPASPEEQIEALGIPNWRDLEKKVVRRLDMTLMPCLWVLYLFNYLDRASIAYVPLLC